MRKFFNFFRLNIDKSFKFLYNFINFYGSVVMKKIWFFLIIFILEIHSVIAQTNKTENIIVNGNIIERLINYLGKSVPDNFDRLSAIQY